MRRRYFDSNPHGRLNLLRLAEFEERLGRALPGGYRQYLIRHNGGLPTPRQFARTGDRGEIAALFGIHRGPRDERLQVVAQTAPDALPIGRLADGRLLVLCLRGAERGSILMEGESTLISRSFAGLLALLGEICEDVRSPQEAAPSLSIRAAARGSIVA
ncbi:MAG: SMI1/KNR4 family protein [Phycisphaerales bacterium]|nr:SMI1/KNR4 family protein [Phycisphaerales bacterium]